MDEIPLEDQIAKVKAENATLDGDIAKAAAVGVDRDSKYKELREQLEIRSRKTAILIGLCEQNEELARENARMEGREYHDPDDPDYEYPEPPDEQP